MTVHIIVTRGDGLTEGEPIIDPFIGTVGAALDRGRNELDEQASNLQPVVIEAPYRVAVKLGQLVQVEDDETPEVYRAKIIGIDTRFAGVEIVTVLRLIRPG